jgi:succinylglutamate desuccinylase
MSIKRVLLVGGTHGNELTGVYLIKKLEQYPDLMRRDSFETLTLLGNPRAIAVGVRYIDQDLNRSFNLQKVTQTDSNQAYESQRAREIRAQFGQAGHTPIDLIIDQHSTTANVGIMLILDALEAFTLNLAAHLTSQYPAVKVYSSVGSNRKLDSLRSIAKYRIGIEIGPIAHGTIHAALFQENERIIQSILDYVEDYNRNPVPLEVKPLRLFQYVDTIDYPRNAQGEIRAMIHPQLQFRDYLTLNPGDPMFVTFDGEVIAYSGTQALNPLFIGESAYLEKGIAMIMTQDKQLELIPSVSGGF